MASILNVIFPCLPIGAREGSIQLPTSTGHQQRSEMAVNQIVIGDDDDNDIDEKLRLRIHEAASSIVSAMRDADKHGPSLDVTIQSEVHQAGGWSEYLAKKILAALEIVLKAGQMNAAMEEAYGKACEAAKVFEGFAADHPLAAVFCTIVAIGVLVVLAPYAVEMLGFGELGPIEGECCFL